MTHRIQFGIDKFRLMIVFTPRMVLCLLAMALMIAVSVELGSETLIMTTTYPSPAGIYAKLVTTQNTDLARDNQGSLVTIGKSQNGQTTVLSANGIVNVSSSVVLGNPNSFVQFGDGTQQYTAYTGGFPTNYSYSNPGYSMGTVYINLYPRTIFENVSIGVVCDANEVMVYCWAGVGPSGTDVVAAYSNTKGCESQGNLSFFVPPGQKFEVSCVNTATYNNWASPLWGKGDGEVFWWSEFH